MSHVLSDTWALTMSRMRLAMRNRAFLFFSLIMPIAFLFIYAGIFGRGNGQAVPYLLAEVLALTVMGSFWGLSVQLVTFREQGILRRFRVTPVGASAMLASSLLSNYFLTLPTIVIEFFLVALGLSHVRAWATSCPIFVLVTLGTICFRIAGVDRGQRDQHDAGNADHQPDHLVRVPFYFRRDDSLSHAAGHRSSGRRISSGHIPGQRLATRDDRQYGRGGLGRVYGVPGRLRLDRLSDRGAALPLGPGSESSTPREALGRGGDHSLSPSGRMGNCTTGTCAATR